MPILGVFVFIILRDAVRVNVRIDHCSKRKLNYEILRASNNIFFVSLFVFDIFNLVVRYLIFNMFLIINGLSKELEQKLDHIIAHYRLLIENIVLPGSVKEKAGFCYLR